MTRGVSFIRSFCIKPRQASGAGRSTKREWNVEKGIRLIVAMSAVVAILALAPAAFAQSTGTGYGGEGGVAGQVQQGEGGVAGQTASGTNGTNGSGTAAANATGGGGGVLAFTGLDLALIAGGGLVLLVGGVALSRVVARHPA